MNKLQLHDIASERIVSYVHLNLASCASWKISLSWTMEQECKEVTMDCIINWTNLFHVTPIRRSRAICWTAVSEKKRDHLFSKGSFEKFCTLLPTILYNRDACIQRFETFNNIVCAFLSTRVYRYMPGDSCSFRVTDFSSSHNPKIKYTWSSSYWISKFNLNRLQNREKSTWPNTIPNLTSPKASLTIKRTTRTDQSRQTIRVNPTAASALPVMATFTATAPLQARLYNIWKCYILCLFERVA